MHQPVIERQARTVSLDVVAVRAERENHARGDAPPRARLRERRGLAPRVPLRLRAQELVLDGEIRVEAFVVRVQRGGRAEGRERIDERLLASGIVGHEELRPDRAPAEARRLHTRRPSSHTLLMTRPIQILTRKSEFVACVVYLSGIEDHNWLQRRISKASLAAFSNLAPLWSTQPHAVRRQ